MTSLRILIGAETYPPDVNGAARFAERLAGGLAGRGHEVHVVTPSPTGSPSREIRDGITVHGVRSHRYFRHEHFQVCMPWEAFPATTTLLAEIQPDVVHTQAHMVVGRGVVKAAHRAGRPLVATNHLMPENLAAYSPLPRWLQPAYHSLAWKDLGRVFARADVVTAPTPRAVELLVARAGLPDAFPVSCGIDADRYQVPVREPHAVPTVLFVGRLDQEKRVDELIRAMAALPADLPAALEVVGDGARRSDWTELAAGLGMGERVRFRGFISEDELLQAYAGAAVFCCRVSPSCRASPPSRRWPPALRWSLPTRWRCRTWSARVATAGSTVPGTSPSSALASARCCATPVCAVEWVRRAASWSPRTISRTPWIRSSPSTSGCSAARTTSAGPPDPAPHRCPRVVWLAHPATVRCSRASKMRAEASHE